jgi:hypothetical protein
MYLREACAKRGCRGARAAVVQHRSAARQQQLEWYLEEGVSYVCTRFKRDFA